MLWRPLARGCRWGVNWEKMLWDLDGDSIMTQTVSSFFFLNKIM